MSSFALEDFVGNGVLRKQLGNLMADGWDDVPTLKMMSTQDMDTLQLTQLQRDALEIRTYLHDKNMMEYGDVLEASGKTLSELLRTSALDLSTVYKMRRGHVARFLDRGSACAIQMPMNLTLPARKITATNHGGGTAIDKEDDYNSFPTKQESRRNASKNGSTASSAKSESRYEMDTGYQGMRPSYGTNSNDGYAALDDHGGYKAPVVLKPIKGQQAPESKGVFSAAPVEPRLCGLVRPAIGEDEITPLVAIEKIMIQKLTPAHSKGVNPFKDGTGLMKLPPPTKASDLWAEKPTLVLCLRRPGCVMCRAEAHQLYARKPIFDAMGIQLVVCLNERIDAEVRSFWPRYWGGVVVVDEKRDFFKALGGGKLPTEGFITGFLFNPLSIANHKRATATGIEGNLKGEGNIKGGLYIIRPGNGGVAYQFVERNFGDWAPLEEVLDVCSNIQQKI